MKLTLKQLKKIINEELSRPRGMGTGGAPMETQDDDEPNADPDYMGPDFDDDVDGEEFPSSLWNDEEAYDDPEDRPTFRESKSFTPFELGSTNLCGAASLSQFNEILGWKVEHPEASIDEIADVTGYPRSLISCIVRRYQSAWLRP